MVQLSSISGNRASAAGEPVHRDPTRALLNSFVTAKATSLARQGELDKAADTLLPFIDSNLASDELCVLLAKIYGNDISLGKDYGQRVKKGCGCGASVDIGSYNLQPCYNNCLFCYANPRKRNDR